MSNSVFLNYGTSYFDLLSQRIDDNEAEITDVDFAKLNKPDPINPNALLYVLDADGNTGSSDILCQSNNALQSVGCLQLPGTLVNPASVIPELAGQTDTTVWLSSANGHLYRGSVDLESGGGSGNVNGAPFSTDRAIVRWDGSTGRVLLNSGITITDSGSLSFPNPAIMRIADDRIMLVDENKNTVLGLNSLNVSATSLNNSVFGTDVFKIAIGTITENTVIGTRTLLNYGAGQVLDNTIVGNEILRDCLISAGIRRNTLLGTRVMASKTGSAAMVMDDNIVIGYEAGILNVNASSLCSNNIWISSPGAISESNTTRLGNSQTSFYAAGIHGAVAASITQKNVKINSNGRLVGTYETRPYGCYALTSSSATPTTVAPIYNIAYVANSNADFLMGGAPTSYFSSDGLFVAGSTAGSFKYLGAATVLVKYTWNIIMTSIGLNWMMTTYLRKNNIIVPNTVVPAGHLNNNLNANTLFCSVSTNDEIQIGYTTIGGSGSFNIAGENRFVEIIG